ncbi:MAG: PKD domain-containing protein [Bacteroidota bacterium]|nr:PKD domain-containing protein [Bacteroidota bacterium]
MRQQLRPFVLSALFFLPLFSFAQQVMTTTNGCPGVPGACGSGLHSPAPQPTSPSTLSTLSTSTPNTPQNGNGTLGNIYSLTACGLNFSQASQRLGRRFSPQGILQPAPFTITGIPVGAVIQKAYLWAEGSGNGAAQTATVNGPLGITNYPMAIVGSGPDKCWNYAGSYTYRADVTASVNGNGTYNVSGILTNPPTAGNDMDGATLFVVWTDPTQTYNGTIQIDDGCRVIAAYNATTTHVMTYPPVCGPTTNAIAFVGVGDLQLTGSTVVLNSTPATYTWNWWNFIQANTTVNVGQTSSVYSITSATGDCFNLCVAGLYYRTNSFVCSPNALAVSSTAATCSQCNGTASVSVNPAGAYTYSWAPSGGTGSTATGLCPGTYTVTVTACGTATAVVTVPTLGGSITVANASSTNALCNSQCNGTATVNASGGTAPYTFAWSPAAPSTTTGNSNTATGLCAGTYVVTTTDAAGCTGTQTVTITQPTAISATSSMTPSACGNPNGSATVNPSGGTGAYSYAWATTPVQNTQTATGLIAGTYNCTITDANGCTFITSVTVGGLAGPTTSLFIYGDVGCNGACDGFISVTISGGTGPFTTSWSPSGGNSTTASGLCPGTYTCNVTDANNCPSSYSLTITEPPALTVSATQTDVSCNGVCDGSATVTAGGGSPGYTYAWLPAGGNTATAINLCAGNYTCDVSDMNGCTITQSFTITEPTPLTASSAGFNVTCFGICDGQTVAIPAGGTPNYSFSWSSGCTSPSCPNVCAGSYTVTVTDANGCTATSSTTVTEPTVISITTSTIDAHCNLSDGSASAVFSGGTGTLMPVWYNPSTSGPNMNGIPAGNYFVVITDANGCDDSVFVTINNLAGVSASAGTITPVSCFGGNDGSATVNATGGTGTYTYAWNCSASTTNTATGLTTGPCSVVVTDSAGCTSTVNFTITQPTQLAVNATAVPAVVCAGQSIQMTATGSGGTPGYTYVWTPLNLTGQTQNFAPTGSGPCTITIVDGNGCTDSTVLNYTVNPNPVAGLSGNILAGCSPLCVDFSDLSTISPGNIVQWAWDFGDGNQSTLQDPSHCYLYSGFYTVVLTVTTASGCSSTITMSNYINVYPTPVAAFTANPQPTTELNPTIYFTDMSTNTSSWNWDFADSTNGSSTLQHPSFTYGSAGCFDVVLTATSSNGCLDSTMVNICIDPDVSIYMPNAFTPDGDGVNDYFFPKGLGLDPAKFEMWIFDRWGNLVFHTTDLAQGWDGSVQGHTDLSQQDVYVWKVRVGDLNGGMHSYIGHVSMIH